MTAVPAALRERPATGSAPAPVEWHVVTGEYPPQEGGVSDYTRLVARGLADQGDRVIVWAPPATSNPEPTAGSRIEVRRLPDRFGRRSLQMIAEALKHATGPHRLLVQYVPHAFGWKGANVPFCVWLRSRRRDHVWVMFHEVAYPFDWGAGIRPNALAAINRLMASLVGGAAERTFVSIPAWRAGVEAVTRPGTPLTWLPVPNAIEVAGDRRKSDEIAGRVGQGHPLVGHFGTYGALIEPLVTSATVSLLDSTDCRVLLIGRGSREACTSLLAAHPRHAGRVHATDSLGAEEISHHLRACTLMMQPYPDGVSSRRTSAMAALAHGLPLVTTDGSLSEDLWRESGAVVLVPAGDTGALAGAVRSLIADPSKQRDLSRRGVELYDSRFHIRHSIAALRARD